MPDWAAHIRARLAALRLSPTRENEIVEELSQHLEDRWRELVTSGAQEDEAMRLALADLREGNLLARHMTPLRRAHAPAPIAPGTPAGHMLGDLWQDLSYAARLCVRQPGFAAAGVLSLALAIGVNTTIYVGLIESSEYGVSTRGDFEPLVSEQTCYRAQAVSDGRVEVTLHASGIVPISRSEVSCVAKHAAGH